VEWVCLFVCMSVCLSQVMLVSLRAGGVGLNLIGGNHLFLIDMHWFVDSFDFYLTWNLVI